MSRQRKISAFFGQGQPENNAENTETDEAEPGKDQGSEPKAKVAKLQDSWLEKYKWLKYDPAKGTPMDFPKIPVLCSVRVANNQVNPILSPVVA